MHILEAAQKQDRKEAEDLLSGFNRPGRGPKLPRDEGDFVDYYARKKKGATHPMSGDSPRGRPAPGQAPTVVKQRWDERPTRETPAWVPWLAIGAGMLVLGGGVAFLATSGGSTPSHPDGAKSAATITASTMTSEQRDAVPPPSPPSAPVDPQAITTTPITVSPTAPSAAPRGKRDRHGPTPSSTEPLPAAGTGTTGPTRDDLIRDM